MMRIIHITLIVAGLSLISSCGLDSDPASISGYSNSLCFDNAVKAGYVFRFDGRIYLRDGVDVEDDGHFNITGWELKPCQLNLALGKEHFDALIDPTYVRVSEYADDYDSTDLVIVLKSDDKQKVYPYKLLTNHELINDVVDGYPVMVHYSILGGFGAVYSRRYCDTTLTFAVSGYTYWDYDVYNATNSFLLWDRETRSVWWPLINKGVSGLMQGRWMIKYDESLWWESTWGDVLNNYPDALLLEADQTMEPPADWPVYSEVNCK